MNSSLMLMLSLGGKIDAKALHDMTVRMNARRKVMFEKAADLLFGIVMFFFAGLTFKDAAGNAIDFGAAANASTGGLTSDQKLNLVLQSLQTTTKGTLFRELLRPMLITLAGFIAEMMAPDESLLALVSGTTSSGAAFPSSPLFTPSAVGAAPAPQVGSQYEGAFLQANNGDPHVWHIVNGRKQWVMSPDTMARYGKTIQGGAWTGVALVSQSVIDSFPTGPNEP